MCKYNSESCRHRYVMANDLSYTTVPCYRAPITYFEADCRLDDPNKILGPGQTGEICAQGPQIVMGYLENPTASAETFKDGWFHTGDVGHIDEEGLFHIEDRIKECVA